MGALPSGARRLVLAVVGVAGLLAAAIVLYELVVVDGPDLDDRAGVVAGWRHESDVPLRSDVPLEGADGSTAVVREGERRLAVWWTGEACGDDTDYTISRRGGGLAVAIEPDPDGGGTGCESILIVYRLRLDLAEPVTGPVNVEVAPS